MSATTRLFFATDIHASTRCFKKFLNAGQFYDASVLIVGGDVTGKSLIPIVREGGGRVLAYNQGGKVRLRSEDEARAFENKAADAGVYTYRCTEEQLRELSSDAASREMLFTRLICDRMTEWVDLADRRLAGSGIRAFFNTGNDDIFDIDAIIDDSEALVRPEGDVVEIDSLCTMISSGYANITPFKCPRDVPEEVLGEKISSMVENVRDVKRCIFNLHCPPYQSQLDNAPKLDEELQPHMSAFGIEHCPVGSTTVRAAIERHQPLLGLHGHIHESRAAVRIGRTLCINPGSEYHEGVLRGALVELHRGKLLNYTLTSG